MTQPGRDALRALLRTGLRLRARGFAPAPGASVLVLAPHPDDEALGCGGTLAKWAASQVPVRVVYLTDGSASHPGHPALAPEALARQRETEARAAASALGLADDRLTFLRAPDSRLPHLTEAARAELVARLAALLAAAAPRLVLAPSRHDGSSEHEAAIRLLQAALAQAGCAPRLLEFPVWSWWSPRWLGRALLRARRVVRVDTGGSAAAKASAIACHRSQVEPAPPWPRAVLSPRFVRCFHARSEYFFEF